MLNSPEKEKRLHQEWADIFDSFAVNEQERAAWNIYAAEYSKRKADWTGFHECQAVRVDDGRTGVITILGFQCCGLIEVDLEQRKLLGQIHNANTPNQLTPLQVEPAMAAELKTLVKKVHGPSSAVKPLPDLLAKHLPSWKAPAI